MTPIPCQWKEAQWCTETPAPMNTMSGHFTLRVYYVYLSVSMSLCLSLYLHVGLLALVNLFVSTLRFVSLSSKGYQFSSSVVWAVLGSPYALLWPAHTDLREVCATGGLVLRHSAAPTAQAAHRGQEGLVERELQAQKTPENTPLCQERASESGDWCKGLNHHRPPHWGRVKGQDGYKQKERQRFLGGHLLSIQSDWHQLHMGLCTDRGLNDAPSGYLYWMNLFSFVTCQACWSLSKTNQIIFAVII